MSNIITRIAPSPTGNLHIGTARTALFSYLYAKKHGGQFWIRSEDTDKERSKPEFEENILSGLARLGITHDGFVRQSERHEVHAGYLAKMIKDGFAYVSKEEAGEGKRGEVIRFKNPNEVITFHDEIRGLISFDTTDLGDFVIAKSLSEPLYHLAVVVDDFDMKVTHVIRGEDHISNTPRQILIARAIGAPIPTYAHLPLILAADRSKMSKRHGAVSIDDYFAQGFIAPALINYLGLLGFNPGGEQEVFTLDELVQVFSIDRIQKGGAVFDIERLSWFNKQHLARYSNIELFDLVEKDYPLLAPLRSHELVSTLIRERLHRSTDIATMAAVGELDFLVTDPSLHADQLRLKGTQEFSEIQKHLGWVLNTLESHNDWSSPDAIKACLWSYAEEQGKGNVLWPLRVALSGKEKSPDPFTIAAAIGRDATLSRITHAISLCHD